MEEDSLLVGALSSKLSLAENGVGIGNGLCIKIYHYFLFEIKTDQIKFAFCHIKSDCARCDSIHAKSRWSGNAEVNGSPPWNNTRMILLYKEGNKLK